ncbi:hypothetical protein WJX73_004008 [Symbiochloris irregularis]|uniref:SAP domain-containing protein n=1 Tax=Symbiochloris irregularis TaxID=706552 RepID=A0AAW1NYF6_9CHLO
MLQISRLHFLKQAATPASTARLVQALATLTAEAEPLSQLIWPPPGGAFVEHHPSLAGAARQEGVKEQASALEASRSLAPDGVQHLERNLLDSFNRAKSSERRSISRSILRQIPVIELRQELKAANLESAGLKEDLVTRILDHLPRSGPPAAPSTASALQPLQAGVQPKHGPDIIRRRTQSLTPPQQLENAMTRTQQIFDSPEQVAQILQDAHCDDVNLLDVRQSCDFTDYFIASTARSNEQLFSAANAVVHQSKLRRDAGQITNTAVLEGRKGSDWLVVDAGSIVVHVFMEAARRKYNLERRWTPGSQDSEAHLDFENMTLDDL